MTEEKPLAKILDSLREIFAKDLTEKPARREHAIADPALWRAIKNQQKNSGDVFLSAASSTDSKKSRA